MPNALQMGGHPPIPRPDLEQQQPLPTQPQMPAPSHSQTCAAIRHFMAIIDELQALEKDPALGKSDCKMQIIDGFSRLVAERMIAPGTAVMQLAGVPSDPQGQRKWMKQMLQQTIAAQNNVLDHHVAAHPATLDWAQESQHQAGSRDNHMSTMDGLLGLYRPQA